MDRNIARRREPGGGPPGTGKKAREAKKNRWKIRLIQGLILLFIAILCYRIIYLKSTYGKEFELRALSQLTRRGSASEQSITPNRGAITDRNREKNFASSYKTYSVFIDVRVLVTLSQEIQDRSKAAVNEILGIPMEELDKYLQAKREFDETGKLIKATPLISDYDKNYLIIARDITKEQAEALEEENPRCVYIEENTKRAYPDSSLAAQTIGFMSGGSSWGLERQYESFMSGTPGRIYREFTDNGSVSPKRIDPVDGFTVVTTIDERIQAEAEALVTKYGEMFEAKNAAIIVMNPMTGEILTLASYPSFNLNDPFNAEYITKSKYRDEWDTMTDDEKKKVALWNNYAVSSTFEPGSIFKPFVVAAALEENVVSPESRYYCPGYKKFSDNEDDNINCHKLTGHGSISLNEALAQSCNVALMDIAEAMGRDLFYKYQRDFGFGEKTGVDLPDEVSALSLIHGISALNTIELATSSFGQRFNCTPIQIINGFAALINGGYVMRPYVVSRIMDKSGGLVEENLPVIERKVISKETSEYLKTALKDVMSPTGTGKSAYIEGYSIGGKTGTGEQGVKTSADYHYAVSMISYFPAENPEFLVLSIIDYPKEFEDGVTSSAPMSKEIMEFIIKYRNIAPERGPEGLAGLIGKAGAVTLPEFTAMPVKEAVSELNRLGLDYEFIGAAGTTVIKQYPQAGAKISKNEMVLLTLSDNQSEPLFKIPPAAGMMVLEAENLIRAANLVPIVFYDEQEAAGSPITSSSGTNPEDQADTNQAEYIIYAQMPAKDIMVPAGTEIKLKARKAE